MKNELEQLRKELNDKIDSAIKSLTPKQEFEKDVWYKGVEGSKIWFFKTTDGRNCIGLEDGVWRSGRWNIGTTEDWKNVIISKATKEEIQTALEAEAKKRYPAPCDIKYLDGNIEKLLGYSLRYDSKTDTLHASDMGTQKLYHQGKWAEIITEPKIMIDRYEVTKEKDSFGIYYKIGCKSIRYDALLTISQVMGLNGFKKIKLDEYETTLETINQILEKSK